MYPAIENQYHLFVNEMELARNDEADAVTLWEWPDGVVASYLVYWSKTTFSNLIVDMKIVGGNFNLSEGEGPGL